MRTSPPGSRSPHKDSAGRLIDMLRHQDVERKNAAISALSEMGELAVEPLIGTLAHKSTQEGAIEALVKIGEHAIEPLRTTARESLIRSVREGAIRALEELGVDIEDG